MIYKSEAGINVLQFGTGDICVVCIGDEDKKNLHSVGFFQVEPAPIGNFIPEYDGKTDEEVKTHTKLLFTDPKSVDVVIQHLEMIKSSLLNRDKHK